MDQITIQGNTYNVPTPYKAGPHDLTEGEAGALNQTLHENLRNNLAKKGKEGTLTQADVDEYAAEYKFGAGTRGGPSNPVMTQAMGIARARVKARLKEMINQPGSKYYGRSMKDFTAEAITNAARKTLDENPSIMELARDRVEKERHAAAEAIGDLGDLGLPVEGEDQPQAAAE